MTRFVSISFCTLALAAAALAPAALAQPTTPAAPAAAPAPPAMKPVVFNGVITGLDGMKLTVKDASGASRTFDLNEKTRLIRVSPISLSDIKPGSFVATANNAETGVSSELRVFGPSLNHLGEGSYPMQDGQNMTNGSVKVVVSSPKGRELDVGYDPKCTTNVDDAKCKAGVRHITVPANMVIHAWDAVALAELKAGAAVSVRGGEPAAGGPAVVRAVFIGVNGQPPALGF
jgi:hypothetical protein